MSIEGLREEIDKQLWEKAATDLLFDVGGMIMKLAPKRVVSLQVVLTDHLHHMRDRTENDVHLFLDLPNGEIFHLKLYLTHMMSVDQDCLNSRAELTAYRKPDVTLHGGSHSLRQGWYSWNAELIARSVIEQNQDLFAVSVGNT